MFSSRSLMLATVIALAPIALQAQAATTCKDGTTSTATGKGACSGHGGVKAAKSDTKASTKAAKSESKATTKAAKADVKADKAGIKADTKASKADAKADSKQAKMVAAPTKTASNTDATGATAKCKDGTYSHAASRRGACSKHGGVAEWLKT